MQIVLIRHGQPDWAPGGLSTDDPDLTPAGHEQARRMAQHLAPEQFDRLLVSPLRRAQQTAAPLEVELGRPAEPLDWLAEIRNPQWEGTPVAHVERLFADQRRRPVDALWDGLEGGESFHRFHDRVTGGLIAHLASEGVRPWQDHPRLWQVDDPGRRIVAVAHAGTNAVAIGGLLGIPPVPWEWERFVSFHASITVVESVEIAGGRAFTLRRFSDLSHLPVDLQTR